MVGYTVQGEVAPGYESVRSLFDKYFRIGMEECSQLCVYVKGQKVVDLCGARIGKDRNPIYNYDADSVQNVFSSSKVVTSFVIAMLVDRGLLTYDQLVTDIWPDFGKTGKASPTIAEVAKHESGIPVFRTMEASELSREAIKAGEMASFIEGLRPQHKPGSKRVYHVIARGCILNEIVRRVDPQGRTIGEFLRDEIAEPLNLETSLVLGIQDRSLVNIAPVTARSYSWTWLQLILPRWVGGGGIYFESACERVLLVIGGILFALLSSLRFLCCRSQPVLGVSINNGRTTNIAKVFNSEEMRKAELPSANMHASARAMAKLANIIVQGASDVEGVDIISEEGLQSALGDADKRPIHFNGIKASTCFTNAGWNMFLGQRYGFTGWFGFGGSAMQWHDEEHVAFAYAMNSLERVRLDTWRSKYLQKEVLKCAKALSKDVTDEPS